MGTAEIGSRQQGGNCRKPVPALRRVPESRLRLHTLVNYQRQGEP